VEKPAKQVRVKRLFRKKTPQKKREQAALQTQKREKALQEQEASYSNERYVSPEEALGPVIYNERYLKKAAVYRYLRYGIVILLVVFLVGMLNLFKEEITIENFRYLMRNVDFELRTELGEAGNISYDSNPLNTFAIYKGSLAQLSDRQIAIYDASGRSSYTGNLHYDSPALASSDKYLLAFDRTGGDYSLYTGFSQVHTATTGYPIADVDLSDEGVYVIASRSKEYFGVVEVYSSSFQLMNKIQKNKYIASVDLAEDGKNLLISSYFVGDTGICTELMILSIDSDKPSLLLTVEGTVPLEAAWISADRFVLVCDQGVKFYDLSGKLCDEYDTSKKNTIEYNVSLSNSRIALLYKEATDTSVYRLCVLNADGKTVLEHTFRQPVEEITFGEDRMILLSGNTAYSLTEDGTVSRFEHDVAIRAAVAEGDALYLCTATRVIEPEWSTEKN
ncbi:MAG: hypothetical protein IJ386_03365, partial [Clostridia bacterium]|nr:hypothetical protein [Clostridia bacterium]